MAIQRGADLKILLPVITSSKLQTYKMSENCKASGSVKDKTEKDGEINEEDDEAIKCLSTAVLSIDLNEGSSFSQGERSINIKGSTKDLAKSSLKGNEVYSSEQHDIAVKLPVALVEAKSSSVSNFDSIASLIKGGKISRIITMAGAGISTSAGIPDFRSPETGLYSGLEKYDLPYPEALFDLDYFKENPQPFYKVMKKMLPSVYFKPTKTHYFIKLLMMKNVLRRHYTQNIDNLERLAGIEEDLMIEAHGSFNKSHCLDCMKSFTFEWIKERVQNVLVPRCDSCYGVIKPDIVFFGESLPRTYFKTADVDLPICDLLIIMGSSLEVQPFANLSIRTNPQCPRILVNNEMVGNNLGLTFNETESALDIAWIGKCDDFCDMFVKKLGWERDLKNLMESAH